MSNSTAGGSSVFGILNQKGFTKEEIQELSDYLDRRVTEYTQPILQKWNRDRKVAVHVYWITLVAILSLPDQALLIALRSAAANWPF